MSTKLTPEEEKLAEHLCTDPEEEGPIEIEDVLPKRQVAEIVAHGREVPALNQGIEDVPSNLMDLIKQQDHQFKLGVALATNFLNAASQYLLMEELAKKAEEAVETGEPIGTVEMKAFSFITLMQGFLYLVCVELNAEGYTEGTKEDGDGKEEGNEETAVSDNRPSTE